MRSATLMRPASGGDDDRVLRVLADVLLDHRHGGEVIDGSIEESLNLTAVKVDGHHALGASGLEEIGDEASRDRFAPFGLAVLSGVSVEGAHRGDAFGRRALGGVDHDELLHDRVVDRSAIASEMALHDEDVRPANALTESRAHFAVGELDEVRLAQFDSQKPGNFASQSHVGPTGIQRHSLGRDLVHLAHIVPDLLLGERSSSR